MKFSGDLCLKITLKVTKKQDFTLSSEDTFFEKSQGWGIKLTPPPPLPFPAVLGLKLGSSIFLLFIK